MASAASASVAAYGTSGQHITSRVAPGSSPADWRDQIVSLRPPDTSIAQACVLDDVQLRFRAALANVKHPRTAEEARTARALVRRDLAHSLGLHQFPWPPNLQAHQTGTFQQEGFRIEKIVYQTFPGSLVPALLYVPNDLKAPAPAIVLYIGHWWPYSKADPDQQAVCINLARMGFVVLTWDPFGQGERGISSRDHRRVEALLVGISEQGYAEYETQCALSYLCSRPEVDAQRIGMTGASGGGYNTWVTAVLDDRIQVAVPVVGTSEFYEQIWSTRFLAWGNCVDNCHHVAGLVRYANNHEFLACVAPRPLCMIAAHDDDFPADGVLKIYEYGRKLYESFGARDKIKAFVDTQAGHGYQVRKREVAYGWLSRWLLNKGDGEPLPEPPTKIIPPDSPDLRCFPVGQNQSSGPGMVRIAVSIMEKLPAPVPPADLDLVFGNLPPFGQRTLTRQRVPAKAGTVQRLEFPSENGISVPGFFVTPETTPSTGLIMGVDDRGKEALVQDPFIQLARSAGWAVCGVDVRGIGELAVERIRWVACASLLMNENFVWRQGWDLACALQCLYDNAPGALRPLVLYGRGDNSALAVLYALAQNAKSRPSDVRAFLLRDGFLSFRQFIDRPESLALSYRLRPDMRDALTGFDHEIPYRYFVFDALRSVDLPQLLQAANARGLAVNPVDGDWKPMAESAARQLLPASMRLLCESRPENAMLQFIEEAAKRKVSDLRSTPHLRW